MTLEELKQESYKDLPVTNVENIDQESFYNQEIKAKWLDYKSRFELLLARSKGDYQVLYREKWEYYGGKSDAKVYAAKPFDLKVLKTDLQIYISSDSDVIELSNKIAYLETTIKFIDGVIKSIDNRGWDIKHAITWKQFEAGMI
jgi:lipopolysaccharide export LptBFGC system permease protein LptF